MAVWLFCCRWHIAEKNNNSNVILIKKENIFSVPLALSEKKRFERKKVVFCKWIFHVYRKTNSEKEREKISKNKIEKWNVFVCLKCITTVGRLDNSELMLSVYNMKSHEKRLLRWLHSMLYIYKNKMSSKAKRRNAKQTKRANNLKQFCLCL